MLKSVWGYICLTELLSLDEVQLHKNNALYLCRCEEMEMWNNIKIFCQWFRKVMKMNIAFRWFWSLFKFFLFQWRFADWPWNVVNLLGYQVPVPFFDLIFWICDTCRCETTLKVFADDSGKLWKWI